MQSEASSQQLSTHSNKTGSDQTSSLAVQGSVYDPISPGSSRRSSESGEPLPNGLTTHLHQVHVRAQTAQHLSNTSNLVLLPQNESLASDTEGFQHNFIVNQPVPIQLPSASVGQQSMNQNQPAPIVNGKPHHPNQDVILQQLDENKPIEENRDLILPEEVVNFINRLNEQTNRPPSVISEAITSVSRYVPPSATMNNQPKTGENTVCTNHTHPQSCSQTPQNWPSCSSCCNNPHNSCTIHNCSHNHTNVPNGNQQAMQNCCYSNNKSGQQQSQGCYNEMQKPVQTHSICANNNPQANMQKVSYNQNTVPYAASLAPSSPQSNNLVQSNCYQSYNYPQQQMDVGYSHSQHFNSTSSVHSDTTASQPKSNYIQNNNQTNNYLQTRPYMGNSSLNYENNHQNQYPSQDGMQSQSYATNNNAHGSCPQPNYPAHHAMDKPLNSPGHMSQYNSGFVAPGNQTTMNQNNLGVHHSLPHNQNLAMINQNSINYCNSAPVNHNPHVPAHPNNQMPFKQSMSINQNLQVMHSDSANQHQNYIPQNNIPYNANMQQWCNNHSQNYNYNQNCNSMAYSQETPMNVPHNHNGMIQHPNQMSQVPQSYNNMPHQSCVHKMGMNRQCANPCGYNNHITPIRTDSAHYQMQQQTPAQMQYPVIPPNQYQQDPKVVNCESQVPMNSNVQFPVDTACQNQLPPDMLPGNGNHCCNHRLGTSVQAQHSASSLGDQDEKESSVSVVARSSHTCSSLDQKEIQCQNVSQSSLSGEAYQRTLKYVQQCQELLGQQQPSPGCNRVSSSTDRHSPAESHSPLLQTSNMVINDLNTGLSSLVEETRSYVFHLLH